MNLGSREILFFFCIFYTNNVTCSNFLCWLQKPGLISSIDPRSEENRPLEFAPYRRRVESGPQVDGRRGSRLGRRRPLRGQRPRRARSCRQRPQRTQQARAHSQQLVTARLKTADASLQLQILRAQLVQAREQRGNCTHHVRGSHVALG